MQIDAWDNFLFYSPRDEKFSCRDIFQVLRIQTVRCIDDKGFKREHNGGGDRES